MSRSLRILVAIPAGWTMYSEHVKWMQSFISSSPAVNKDQVSVFYELSATRLDFSLSKIIALGKRFHPDVLLRFDADCIPTDDIGTVARLCESDFRSGFDLVFSPTRSAQGWIMSLAHDPKSCESCSKGLHPAEIGKCTEQYFGALGYSALSPKLIEAYRPHTVEYGPAPDKTGRRQVRYICNDWSQVLWDEIPESEKPKLPEGWERRTELSEIDPELNAHTPMFVVNPPDNSEDSDICYDVRENGYKIGADARLHGSHLHKRSAIPNWGSGQDDKKAWEEQATGKSDARRK